MNKKFDKSRHITQLMELSAFFHRLFRLATEPAKEGKTSMIRYYILKILEHDGKKNLTEISNTLFLKKNALSQLLDRMVNDGLIERYNDTIDRRKIILSLTPNGQTVIKEFETIISENMKKYALNAPEKDMEEFMGAVDALVRIIKKNQGGIDRCFENFTTNPEEIQI